MMKIRIYWKLTAIFCSAVVAALLLGHAYLKSQLTSFLEQDLQSTLRRELFLARDLIQENIGIDGVLMRGDALAHRIGSELGVRATVISLDGRVVGDSQFNEGDLKGVENHADRVEVKDALRVGLGVSKRYSYTLKKYLLYVAMPFGKDKPQGVVRLAMPVSEIELLKEGPLKTVMLALVLVFLVSFGFTYLIAIFISRPLRQMSAVARRMADGDFSGKILVHSDDEVGDLGRAITHMSDEIREKIEDIEDEKAKLDAVISNMFEGVLLVDPKGTILLMNPSLRKMFFADVDPQGRRAVEVIRNSSLLGMIACLLEGKERSISREVSIISPDEKMLKVNAVAIRSAGKLDGAVLVFHDITELRRLEKVRQDFVANVSHELRTPVASIKGYAETLLSGAMDDKEALKEFLGTIHHNSDRLSALINDLLDLARIESGSMQIMAMPMEALPVIRRCLAILEKTIQAKGLSVSVDAQDGSKVLADEARFSQVVLNLLDNAVKYTPDGGAIMIKAVAGDKVVRFDVIDTGVGIPEQDLPRIFERFYRVDKARSRDMGGTGLGLSIVKHIVQAHGGEVFVSSQLGQGTTFSFVLPIA